MDKEMAMCAWGKNEICATRSGFGNRGPTYLEARLGSLTFLTQDAFTVFFFQLPVIQVIVSGDNVLFGPLHNTFPGGFSSYY